MNQLSNERRTQVIKALVDGVSIRATCRMTGTAKGTVLRLVSEIGEACSSLHDEKVQNIQARQVQCDEVWSFVSRKEGNIPQSERGRGEGDAWTYSAIDSDSKLVISWYTGRKDKRSATAMMMDLASRLAGRVQLTTDGWKVFRSAVETAFGWNGADYAQLYKVFGRPDRIAEARYSPALCLGTEKHWVMGEPVKAMVSTSHIERQNLTVRMHNRRFTRLTNAFSKKFENHCHSLALHFVYYNFCRPHQTLTKRAKGVHTTPAMVAGLTNRVWKIEDLVGLIENRVSRSN